MLSLPFKGATKGHISQTFHESHKALDMISFRTFMGYGTPLCAPEDIEVIRIVGDTYTPGRTENLERGYGIYLRGRETGLTHLYWHTLPIFPVRVLDIVKRGQIVAYMGNAGHVTSGGRYVPVTDRLPSKKGTHLHWEVMDKGYRIFGEKPHLNPLDFIDWSWEPTYTAIGEVKAATVVAGKIVGLLSKQ